MPIKRISVKNFKSFRDLQISLSPFNVLIGPNGAGKSNFVSIFKFLRDIARSGLDNAISMQGGVEFIRNMKIGAGENLSLEIQANPDHRLLIRKNLSMSISEFTYRFELKFHKRGIGFRTTSDRLMMKMQFTEMEMSGKNRLKEKQDLGVGQMMVENNNGKIKVKLQLPDSVDLHDKHVFPFHFFEEKIPSNAILLETPIFFIFSLEEIFTRISIYDFDPKLPKKAHPITGKAELEEDGENLSIVLKRIAENKNVRRKLFNLVQDVLPSISNVKVEKLADKSVLFKIMESYFPGNYLPASLISDGTINIIALIVALYLEKNSLAIIEEPERNIHPSLISKTVDMMREVATRKQIVVTTHNPEVVKYAGLENLLFIYRDQDGFSKVERTIDNKLVKAFLKNNLGIEELFVQNLLGR